MAVEIKVTLKDADKYIRAFNNAPELATEEFSDALDKSIKKVEGDAKKNAPVNKQTGGGNLRQSIRSFMRGKATGIVEVGAKYAIYVHEGTRAHEINVRTKKVLANRRTGQIFGKRVQHPGTRANPFLRNAAEGSEGFINNLFTNALTRIAKSFTK